MVLLGLWSLEYHLDILLPVAQQTRLEQDCNLPSSVQSIPGARGYPQDLENKMCAAVLGYISSVFAEMECRTVLTSS